ncbi:hypothetical protein FHU30_003249 [Actinomadura rupiterrae]|nr:hypothetical protein [Actinomadura rupiterrae]
MNPIRSLYGRMLLCAVIAVAVAFGMSFVLRVLVGS